MGLERETHPDYGNHWATRITGDVDRLTLVVNPKKIQSAISTFQKRIGIPVTIAYHTKAGAPEITQVIPPHVLLVTTAKDLATTAQTNPGNPLGLHLGRADAIDESRNFLSAPDPKKLNETLDPDISTRVQELILDATVPQGYKRDDYLNTLTDIFPNAHINLRVRAPVSPQARHGHNRGLDLQDAMTALKNYPESGLNFYRGNPITAEMVTDIGDILTSLQQQPAQHDENLLVDFSPARIFIGGFGGYGEDIPFDAIKKFLARTKQTYPNVQTILELGTYVVEGGAILLCPSGWTEQQLRDPAILPDASGSQTLNAIRTDQGGLVVLRPVSYAYHGPNGEPLPTRTINHSDHPLS